MPDSKAASPELNQFMLEFEKGRLCGMTLYEILSLAINLAVLILTTLSYLKNRKELKSKAAHTFSIHWTAL